MRNKNNLLLLLILITGSVLRLLFLGEIPFTHDELSALSRVHYHSFSELIEQGVMVLDTHPAGVQVFLYFWTQCFGVGEIAVKTPFILMGILSILMVYLIGKKWFNETVGLISASFIATMQFTIVYSQLARPYASGMFLCLAMVYFWSRLILEPSRKYWLNLILYILFSALCAYNHHFSLLFAAIVGVTGLFFVRKKQLLYYVLGGVAIFLLYTPHLNIFFYQLSKGGIEEWLCKPNRDFLPDFVKYLFHYSSLVYLMVGVLIAVGMYRSYEEKHNFRLLAVSLAWFLLPVLIGYFYSKYVVAVIQPSMLIFSVPYLFFILFGYWKKEDFKINALLVAVILLVNISTLVLERRHFDLVRKSPYEQILVEHQKVQQEYPGKVLSLLDSHKEISAYYITKDHITTPFIWQDTLGNIRAFNTFLKTQQQHYEYLYFGAINLSNPVLIPIIQDYFPNMVWQKNYSGGTAYLFSRHGTSTQTPVFQSIQDYEKTVPGWNPGVAGSITGCLSFTGKHAYRMDSLQEYGPVFSLPLKKMIINENNFIDISLRAYISDTAAQNILLVSSLESNQKSFDWRAASFADYAGSAQDSLPHWVTIHLSVKLSDIYLNRKNIMVNVYVWNKALKTFYIDDFEIKTRYGNPVIYGLTEKF